MFGTIIIGYDQSDQAVDALALGKLLADATGAKLLVAGVFHFDPVWGRDPWFKQAEEEYARSVERAAESVGAQAEAIPSSSPARGLHELAEETDADLILVGSSHRGRLGQALAGSVGQSLLHGAPCAVGIAPRGYGARPEHSVATIVVGFDGSVESGLALADAEHLARVTGAGLRLVSATEAPALVMDTGGGTEDRHVLEQALRDQAQAALDDACSAVPEGIAVEGELVTGAPAEVLRRAAAEEGAILVVGSRGYGPLRRVMLGSVSGKLTRSAPAPVIVHPRGRHAHSRSDASPEAETAR